MRKKWPTVAIANMIKKAHAAPLEGVYVIHTTWPSTVCTSIVSERLKTDKPLELHQERKMKMSKSVYRSRTTSIIYLLHYLTRLAAQPMTRVLFNEPFSLFFWERYENTKMKYANCLFDTLKSIRHQTNLKGTHSI